MTFTQHHHCRGNLHVVTLKKAFRLQTGTIKEELSPPELVKEPVIEDFVLREENDCYPKRDFVDVVLRGSVYAPRNKVTHVLDAGFSIQHKAHGIRVFGQRKLQIQAGQVSFTAPEPFEEVPLIWEEAYGGHDIHNEETGDIWDLKALGESISKDLSHLNLSRYRRNPIGKGFIMKLKPEHDGFLLPRVEMAHDLLTPKKLESPKPIDWHFQPMPACFDWSHYHWFPRIAFMAEKLFGKVDEALPQKPALPEYAYGYTRDDLFKKAPAHELIRHPRMFNGAHPALQIPNKKQDLNISLWHMDPDQPEFSFKIPYDPPRISMNVPAESKTYKDKAFLSNVVIDMNKKEIITTWHSLIQSKYPITDENKDKISVQVDW